MEIKKEKSVQMAIAFLEGCGNIPNINAISKEDIFFCLENKKNDRLDVCRYNEDPVTTIFTGLEKIIEVLGDDNKQVSSEDALAAVK